MTRLRRSRRAHPLTRVRAIEPGQRSRVALSSQTVLTSGAAETTGVSEGTDAATVGAVSSLIDFTVISAEEQVRLLKLQTVTKFLTEAMLRSQVIGGEARQAAAARVSASVQSDDATSLAEQAIKAAAQFGTPPSEIGQFLVASGDLLQDGDDPLILDVQLTVFQNDMFSSLPDTPVTLGTPFQQVVLRFAAPSLMNTPSNPPSDSPSA